MASVHNIQADVPAANVLAMWKSWSRSGPVEPFHCVAACRARARRPDCS